MKTTLHIITGLSDGGAEAVLYRLCAQDAGGRHSVISLTDAGKYGPLLEEALEVPVICLDMPRGRVTLSGLQRLWSALRTGKPDVVQTWMYHADLLGGVAARLAGRRNVVWGIHNTTLEPGKSRRSTMAVARVCAWLSGVVPRRIVCCAERSVTVHADLGYDRRRMRVVPNGYDLTVFRPDATAGAAVRRELGVDDNEALVGFVARHDPQKDHDTLLLALKALADRGLRPSCLLVGSGLDAANAPLVRRIDDLGLSGQVRLLGRRNDIPAVMNALDLHLMSSAFGEAFPNVLAEAMACGTPCVSTDVGDAAAIVGDTGWIVPPRDPAALAQAVALALQERGAPSWARRRAAARERVETRFSIARMVDSYHAVWFGEHGSNSAAAQRS